MDSGELISLIEEKEESVISLLEIAAGTITEFLSGNTTSKDNLAQLIVSFEQTLKDAEILIQIAKGNPFHHTPSELEPYQERLQLETEHYRTKHVLSQINSLLQAVK
ncbi:hypothetical protein BLNAU_10822 [Blattamonas nauphoetae]|uniref:Mediator complex subunit 11 n=1 Tax=Blattamonas nauphoetae TaxID=2049346 RepID=A0ABQ9XRN5_9EUKA|nr:hypothetical protein BLNAU_10822 [Blattamonas nauphoetae]